MTQPLSYESPASGPARGPMAVAMGCAVLFCVSALLSFHRGLHSGLEPVMLLPWMVFGIATWVFRHRAVEGAAAYPNEAFRRKRSINLLLIAGVVTGVLGTVDAVLSEDPHVHTRMQSRCGQNLRQIGLAMLLYANANERRFPGTLEQLTRFHADTSWSELLVCPEATNKRVPYIYTAGGLTTSAPAEAILAYEPLGQHKQTGSTMLFGDGHVEFIFTDEAEGLIAELEAGFNPPRPKNQRTPVTPGKN